MMKIQFLLFFLVKFLETHLSLNFGTNLGLFGRSKAVEMVGGLMMRDVSHKDVLLGPWMCVEKLSVFSMKIDSVKTT